MRTIWILSEKAWTSVETGPHRRVRSLATMAMSKGHTVHVACPDWKCPPPAGIQSETLNASLLDRIPRGDLLIASPFLSPWIVAKLFRSRHELHVDFYCVSAMEAIESSHRYPAWKLYLGRNRTWRRYMLLLGRSSRFYLSTPAQLFFLAGTLYSRIGTRRDRWLSELSRRAIIAPMGIPSLPSTTPETPYPASLSSRPIFLWGGGIWEWMDAAFLIRAFAELSEKDSGPALYFLAGSNPSGEPSQDQAPVKAVQLAKELGVFERNVWFHPHPVRPTDIPGFLAHCRAGIMANFDNLESLASWRTRYLDLVAAGKPLLVHLSDPLAKTMAASGMAMIHDDPQPRAFSNRISEFLDAFPSGMDRQAWQGIQKSLSDATLLEPVCKSWLTPTPSPPNPSIYHLARWLSGL